MLCVFSYLASASDGNGWGTSTGIFTVDESSGDICPQNDIPETNSGSSSSILSISQKIPKTTTSVETVPFSKLSVTSQSMQSTQSQSSVQPSQKQSSSRTSDFPSSQKSPSPLETTSGQSGQQTPFPQPSQLTQTNQSKSRTIIVVGALAGSVVFLGFVVAFVFCFRHRRRKPLNTTNDTPAPAFIEASRNELVYGAGSESRASADSVTTSVRFAAQTLNSTYSGNALMVMPEFSSANSPLLALWATSPRASVTTTPSVVIQHQDAGRVTELPPPYGSQGAAGRAAAIEDGASSATPKDRVVYRLSSRERE